MGKLFVPEFIDHHPAFAATGYVCTNEEPDLYNHLLGKKRFERIGCICSAGEVPLTVLLPRCDGEFVAVDHSYLSITTFYAKLLLLQNTSCESLWEQLVSSNFEPAKNDLAAKWHHLPQVLRGKYPEAEHCLRYAWNDIRREWLYCQRRSFERSKRAIQKIRAIVHGDVSDLSNMFGKFDLFYTSNAHEHAGRSQQYLRLNTIAPLLNPNGLLIYASSSTAYLREHDKFKTILSVKGLRTGYTYVVAKLKE